MAAAENGQTTRGTATQIAVEQAKYKRLGLTVYVAQTRQPLNLTTDEEVRNHFAWKGANDERMWGKPRGKACYSLIAIPLIDNDTKDLKGVFKIENKQPTLYQLESYFTKEDEQLLTILGNSISLSLIISERIERLRRLDQLVGDIRFLNDLDEALFFILTGLTHRDGLQYNRAMIFLADEADPTKLGFDLRLMSSLNDASAIPTEGKGLIIVAAVNNVLHFRIFDGNGKRVVDINEKKLTGQARQIEDLKKQLKSLWPPHELTDSEKVQVITAVRSIVSHTPKLVCRYAIGHMELAQWEAEVGPTKDEELHLYLDKLLKELLR